MFPVGGVNPTVWAEPKATDVSRGLSVSFHDFWIKAGAGAAWSPALILYLCRGEAEHSHIQPTAALLSFSFIFVFTLHIVPKLSDSARSGNIPSTTISYETLSHAFDCLSLFRAILFCRHTEKIKLPHTASESHIVLGTGGSLTALPLPPAFSFLLCKVTWKWISCLYWAFQWDFT